MGSATMVRIDEDDFPAVNVVQHNNGHRLLRVWRLVEDIAAHPGLSRKQIACKYALSERQAQADLNVIRREMRLPLVRRQGYRFEENDRTAPPQMALEDMELLLLAVGRFADDPRVPSERLRQLVLALPRMVPLHLRPLLKVGLNADGTQHPMFACLASAMLNKRYVRLEYRFGEPQCGIQNPTVQPRMIFPHGDHWYVIGDCREKCRLVLLPLDNVTRVSESF